jgi:hypothetical protein
MAGRVKQSTVIASGVGVAVLLCVTTVFRFSWDREAVATALVVELLGVAVGSLVGAIASPGLPVETERFKQFGKLAAAFATGYVLKYLEPTLPEFFKGNGAFWNNTHVFFLSVLFATSAIAAGLFMYVFRTYTESADATVRKAAVQKRIVEIKKLLETLQSEA